MIWVAVVVVWCAVGALVALIVGRILARNNTGEGL